MEGNKFKRVKENILLELIMFCSINTRFNEHVLPNPQLHLHELVLSTETSVKRRKTSKFSNIQLSWKFSKTRYRKHAEKPYLQMLVWRLPVQVQENAEENSKSYMYLHALWYSDTLRYWYQTSVIYQICISEALLEVLCPCQAWLLSQS